MEKDKLITKKKFLGIVGVGAFTTLLGWNLLKGKKAIDSGTIKMLTPDGKLVEVAKSKINLKQGVSPVSNGKLKNWMTDKL